MAALLTDLLLCLIWGSTWLCIRIGLADMPPFWFLAIRLVVALALSTLMWLRGLRRYTAVGG